MSVGPLHRWPSADSRVCAAPIHLGRRPCGLKGRPPMRNIAGVHPEEGLRKHRQPTAILKMTPAKPQSGVAALDPEAAQL
jgi:hypothetical protein